MKTATSVYITRDFHCPAEDLFRWLIEPGRIIQWFGPKHLSVTKAHVDLKAMGGFSFEMRKPDGHAFFIEGTYLQVDHSQQLVFTLCYQGLGTSTPPDSVVSITLQAIEPQLTRLSLTQKFEIIPPDIDSRTEAWKYMLIKLGQNVQKG